ncbi:MAG TPA: type 4a pilus biogenesis protein PilO [Methylophilaceae bacterium]|jgi:hypothetical protein
MGVLSLVQTKTGKSVGDTFLRYFSIMAYRLKWMPWQQSSTIALLCIILIFTVAMVVPTFSHLAQLRQDIQRLSITIPKHQGRWTPESPEASLSAFYQFLPTKNSINQTLYTLYQEATTYGIATERVEYRLVTHPSSTFLRYEITMPIKGDYQKIRLFINQLLNTFPTLALSEFSLKRNDAQSQEVEAHVKLTLFLRNKG